MQYTYTANLQNMFMKLDSAKSLLKTSRFSRPNLGIIFQKSTLQNVYIRVGHLELQRKSFLVSPTLPHFCFINR